MSPCSQQLFGWAQSYSNWQKQWSKLWNQDLSWNNRRELPFNWNGPKYSFTLYRAGCILIFWRKEFQSCINKTFLGWQHSEEFVFTFWIDCISYSRTILEEKSSNESSHHLYNSRISHTISIFALCTLISHPKTIHTKSNSCGLQVSPAL